MLEVVFRSLSTNRLDLSAGHPAAVWATESGVGQPPASLAVLAEFSHTTVARFGGSELVHFHDSEPFLQQLPQTYRG